MDNWKLLLLFVEEFNSFERSLFVRQRIDYQSLIVVIIEEVEDQFFFKIKFTEVDSWFRVKILE